MSENNKEIENRLDQLERGFDNILYNLFYGEKPPTRPQKLDYDKFAKLYNKVKYDFPMQYKVYPVCIYLNEKYKESAINEHFYPAETEGYYFPKGELSPLCVSFQDMREDFSVECSFDGYFDWY